MSVTFRNSPEILHSRPFIVVGVDGSACSKKALRWALRESQRTGAVVDVVRAWVDPWAVTGPPSMLGAGPAGVAQLREELAAMVQTAAEQEGVHEVAVVEQVLPGNPVDVLVAESRNALMLVVGRRGLGRWERWKLGSVSQHCARLTKVPLVMVPEPIGEAPPVPVSASPGGSRVPTG
jgi:nucleotide-binding universal stress UspA family protein